jgi:hypothetical protein
VAPTAPERDASWQADCTGWRPGLGAHALDGLAAAAAASAGLAGLCASAIIAMAAATLGGAPVQIALALPLLACLAFGAARAQTNIAARAEPRPAR